MMMLSRITFVCAVFVALVAVACDTVPLTAPTGSSVTLSSGASFVPTGGTTEVTAFVSEESGTAVQNGTTVRFTTNLGRIDPPEVQTKNGYAVATFIAGDLSGVANVRATSGGIGSSTSGDTATNSNAVTITVGAAAVETVLLSSNPGSVPAEGGTVELIATVAATDGRALPGIPVTFSSSEGQLASATVLTDNNGQARTTLSTNRTATVTASAAGKQSASITVTRRDPASVATATLTATAGTPVVGSGHPFTFTATVTVSPADPSIQPIRFEWAFGDGGSTTTNSSTTTHVYTTGPNTVRTVNVKIDLTNGQTLVATTQVLLGTF